MLFYYVNNLKINCVPRIVQGEINLTMVHTIRILDSCIIEITGGGGGNRVLSVSYSLITEFELEIKREEFKIPSYGEHLKTKIACRQTLSQGGPGRGVF